MDDASRLALEKAFELAAKQQPPWPTSAILEQAGQIRDFLEAETTAEPLIDRIELLEQLVPQILQVQRHLMDTLDDLQSTSKQSSKPPSTSPARNRGKGRSEPSGPAATTTTQPDDRSEFAATPGPVDF